YCLPGIARQPGASKNMEILRRPVAQACPQGYFAIPGVQACHIPASPGATVSVRATVRTSASADSTRIRSGVIGKLRVGP
ncbi:hypothetical protein OJ587_12215, partial [Streptococcus anginosus]|nr:hypothetical protein [Streptococcus anginosus]